MSMLELEECLGENLVKFNKACNRIEMARLALGRLVETAHPSYHYNEIVYAKAMLREALEGLESMPAEFVGSLAGNPRGDDWTPSPRPEEGALNHAPAPPPMAGVDAP